MHRERVAAHARCRWGRVTEEPALRIVVQWPRGRCARRIGAVALGIAKEAIGSPGRLASGAPLPLGIEDSIRRGKAALAWSGNASRALGLGTDAGDHRLPGRAPAATAALT